MTLPVPSGSPRRVAFLGTPQGAAVALDALVTAGFDVTLVVTRADKRRGRGSAVEPSPVKVVAQRLGLHVSHRAADVVDAGAQLGVVVAFGQLIKPEVLAVVPMVNVHFSLLPRWRGAAPVERAILAGDAQTGVCLMHVAEELDAGAVFASAAVPIGPAETADELRSRLAAIGTELLVCQLSEGLGTPQPQQGEPTYAEKITAADRVLRFANPAVVEHRRVRIGGAVTVFRGSRLKVLRAAVAPDIRTGAGDASQIPGDLSADGTVSCSPGALLLEVVQLEGRAAMPWRDFANGYRPAPGERLG